jgi:hypothetical protein
MPPLIANRLNLISRKAGSRQPSKRSQSSLKPDQEGDTKVSSARKKFEQYGISNLKSEAAEPSVRDQKSIDTALRTRKLVFKCLIDIRDAIITQLTDKVSVIPFCIRQFAKVLYQETRNKFKCSFEESVTLVSEYVLNQWLLQAMLIEPHLCGIFDVFTLKETTKHNMYLIKIMIESIMSLDRRSWTVRNPESWLS